MRHVTAVREAGQEADRALRRADLRRAEEPHGSHVHPVLAAARTAGREPADPGDKGQAEDRRPGEPPRRHREPRGRHGPGPDVPRAADPAEGARGQPHGDHRRAAPEGGGGRAGPHDLGRAEHRGGRDHQQALLRPARVHRAPLGGVARDRRAHPGEVRRAVHARRRPLALDALPVPAHGGGARRRLPGPAGRDAAPAVQHQ
mmetsp:Transcript_36183/g.101868  ORF Transcript_36183/g.101868 Transcript_36183/m.101868 type:complete len:202 (+) Transcript_36183:828-1433(+)